MKKEFNTTGNCFPEQHYMMDNAQKYEEVFDLIERGKYFSMHHPRQFGKTTMLYSIFNQLKGSSEYLGIILSFQGIDEKWHETDSAFGQMFVNQVMRSFRLSNQDLYDFLTNYSPIDGFDEVSDLISDLVLQSSRKLVVLIDEVDASSNYAAFLNFLGMLRNKYLDRGRVPTFHSVVLAGVHDIKNLKFKLRNPEEAQYNSPWNIAADFDVDLSFNPQEIAPMLEQYSKAEGVTMDITVIAERLHYYTAGYPFLVSKICKNIAEKLLKKRPPHQRNYWTLDDIEAGVQMLLQENNTNFESLIKNIENHRDLYDLTYGIVMDGAVISFNWHNPAISKGVLYGVFKRNGKVKIHNRIYEQLIYDYLASVVETQKLASNHYNIENHFILPDGGLDFELVLQRFQQFIKEEYSHRDEKFLERQWRLIFLAFLRPIVNGEGYTFKEVQVSHERRLDIVVTYLQFRYIIELKRWYGEQYHQFGLEQLADYLEIHGLNSGYLVIFDPKKSRDYTSETITHKGKEIFTIWI